MYNDAERVFEHPDAATAPAGAPDGLLQAAYRELQRNDREFPVQTLTLARDVLASVLPLHEQQVRTRVAAELRAVTFRCPTHNGRLAFNDGCIGCQRYAALVGAERIVAGHESPSAKAVREMRQAGTSSEGDGGRR